MSNTMLHHLARNRRISQSTSRQQTGFSLLEVLIAFIILSLGLLGAVGMQAAAMQSNKETRNQTVATSLARELADKMRGNHAVAIKTAAADNPYLMSATLNNPSTLAFTAPAENCFLTACTTATAVATWDMAEWQNRLQNSLPDPKFVICFDKSPFDADGKAEWACSDDGDISVLKLAWTNNDTKGELKLSSAATTIPMVVVPLTAGTPN
jgi:type IV pilus assembly protein PilV